MLSLQDIDAIALSGGIVVGPDGEKVGSVEQIFTSGDSGDPVFVTVRTGLFGMSESFVPLDGATLDGSVITAAFTKEAVKNGPRIESERGTITDTQEQELYRYFALGSTPATVAGGGGSAVSGQSPSGVYSPHQPEASAAAPSGSRRPEPDPAPPPFLPPHLHRHVPVPPGPGHPAAPGPGHPGPAHPPPRH